MYVAALPEEQQPRDSCRSRSQGGLEADAYDSRTLALLLQKYS
jgi:hypothetical protein